MVSDAPGELVVPNRVCARLAADEAVLGMGLQQLRTPAAAALARRCGLDFLFVDLEHGPLSHAMVADLAAASLPLGIPAIVRVPGKGSPDIAKLLDAGAQGIVVPHVDTVDEARAVAAACKYPPLGRRSWFGLQPHFGYRSLPAAEAMALANPQILAVVMLESPEAIAQAPAIAAIPGIDVLLIGCNDLSLELGIPGQLDHPRMESACRDVVDACARHGKAAGVAGIADPRLLRERMRAGMRFVLACNDTDLLIAAGTACVAGLRQPG